MDKKISNEEIVETALKRFKICQDAETTIREEALDDIKFRKGEQWPSDVKNIRAQDNRPCLTINKMPQFVRQITNDQKQNRPAISVSPVDDMADKETARVLKGLIRNIEYSSDAESAYDRAFEQAAQGGFGFFRIVTDYVNEKSFEQEARIEMIDNQFNACLDPYSVKLDGSDAKFGFVWERISKEEFKEIYGDSKLANHADWEGLANSHKAWVGEDDLVIAEYFFKEFEVKDLYLMNNNKKYFKEELGEEFEDENGESYFELNGERLFVVDKRKTQTCKVYWAKLNAIEVLEITEWPGTYIPIIPVYGDVLNVDGERVLEGVIRHAKDPQRILNFWASSEAEAITLAPKAPFIGAEGQFEGHEEQWAMANVKNLSYLEYNPVSLNGTPIGPPQRNAFEPPVQAITNARMIANEDIKSTTGIYDASLGQRSNESSGVAIRARTAQALTSNFHLVDNLSKSIRHAGRILVEIIPKIYDTTRTVRILGESGEEELVVINNFFKQGKEQEYNFSYGKYDVTVSTGPSYETKRQEARDSMVAMSQANPKFAELAADLLVKNMDWPGADEIAERIRKTLPPNILESEDDKIPPQVKAQMDQMNQMVEQLTAQLNEANQLIATNRMELESKERIEQMKVQADIQKEVLKADAKNSSIMLQEEINLIKMQLEKLGRVQPVEASLEQEGEGVSYEPVVEEEKPEEIEKPDYIL